MELPDIFEDGTPADSTAIEAYEGIIEHTVPVEFRTYLEHSNGRHRLEYYCGSNREIYIQNIYQLTSPEKHCDLRYELGMVTIPKSFEKVLVPIGSANGGDRIMLSLNCGEIFIHNYDDDTFEFLDDSFYQFLNRLREDFAGD